MTYGKACHQGSWLSASKLARLIAGSAPMEAFWFPHSRLALPEHLKSAGGQWTSRDIEEEVVSLAQRYARAVLKRDHQALADWAFRLEE